MTRRGNISYAVLLLTLIIGFFEAISFGYSWLKFRHLASPPTFFSSYLAKPQSNGKCEWADFVSPHPYFAIRYHSDGDCVRPNINEYGLAGPTIPLRKDPGKYVILVLGGSVAEQFVETGPGRPPVFEDLLNEKYVSPNGKPFSVINGAIAAGGEPMQAIQFLMLAPLANAVISLEGFNESHRYGTSLRLEAPPGVWDQAVRTQSLSSRGLFFQLAAHSLYFWFRANPILSRSYTAFAFAYSLAAWSDQVASHSMEAIFPPLPTTLTLDERKADFIRRYKTYLGQIETLARSYRMKSAYFLQPVPALNRFLSDRDQSVVGDLSYGKDYRTMVDQLITGSALPIFSLIDLFKDFRGDLYVDHIHFVGSGPGNRMLAEAIATRLKTAWGLQLKGPRKSAW